jgi:HK97 family phage portal protein
VVTSSLPVPSPIDFNSVPVNGVTGVRVTETSSLSNITLMSAVRVIGETVSNLEWGVFKRTGKFDEAVETPAFLDDPFVYWDRQIGLVQIATSLSLQGNAFLKVVARAGLGGEPLVKGLAPGTPVKFMILHPNIVSVEQDDATGALIYKVAGKVTPTEDIIHIPLIMLPGSIRGISPLDAAAAGISWSLALQEFGSSFFSRGAALSGVITTPAELDVPKARALKASFESKHSGVRNSHAVGVLTGGAKFEPITISPEAAQFLSSRAHSDAEIARLMGVPGSLLGLENSTSNWGTGIGQLLLAWMNTTLAPFLKRIESAFTRALDTPGLRVKFDTTGVYRLDHKQQSEIWASALQQGYMNIDEVRAERGMPPLPDGLGQEYVRQLSLAPITGAPPAPDATDTSSPSAPPAPAPASDTKPEEQQ